ncbi:MAG: AcrR family transcriptional regulator [Halocynthiibacter sp.]|jgi:TetR/AcrR family transcriptional repressor of mexJK operon
MTKPSGKIKQGRKFDTVLKGARTVFLRDGFEGASVDDIAREAQVSKATLYSYFSDKRVLFVEVALRECQRQALEHQGKTDLSLPPEQLLPIIARKLVEFKLSDLGRNLYRICIAEADRFPQFVQSFNASGPDLVRASLTAYFRAAITRGELVIEDLELAADQFAELCKAGIFPECILDRERVFSEAEINRVTRGAVDVFMAAYGARTG